VATAPATRRFTVDEYYRMAATGVLGPDERVELIDGEVYEMAPIGSRHAACVAALIRMFAPAIGDRALAWVQNPVRLDDFTEPEPDFSLLRPRPDGYSRSHPGPGDVLLLVEVADPSVMFDRNVKLPRYADVGVVEVWIVDLVERVVEIHRDPGAEGYAARSVARQGDTISASAFPDIAVPVAEIIA
jgi:Uma2 family endonuclease